jgi:hypothetical protein
MGHAELTIQDQTATKRLSLDEYWMPFTPCANQGHGWSCARKDVMGDRGDKIIDASSGFLRLCGWRKDRGRGLQSFGARLLPPFAASDVRLATRVAG